MTVLCRFVDSIAASPSVRLDLNDGTTWTVDSEGLDLSPPPLRRAVSSTMLADGELIPAAAYANRTLTIPLDLQASTEDAAWTATQALWLELNRPSNILELQLGSVPVFFHTRRAPDSTLELVSGRVQYQRILLSIPADPFAYGLQTNPAGSPFTVTNNPAVAGGCYFDVASLKGDVETPLQITVPGSGIANDTCLFATRRRDTPSATPFVLQAEAMTQSTDTATQANDALMSGASNNYSRCTFTGTPTLSDRLVSNAWPASASVDARGTYRVFMRYRRSSGTGAIRVRIDYGPSGGPTTGDVTLPLDTVLQTIDMGLINIPTSAAPDEDEVGGALSSAGVRIAVVAARDSGTSNLDIDYLLFVPADDQLAIIKTSGVGGPPNRYRLDALHGACYGINSGGALDSTDGGSIVAGKLPYALPGITNRVFVITGLTDAVSTTLACTVAYWPRYLLVPGS